MRGQDTLLGGCAKHADDPPTLAVFLGLGAVISASVGDPQPAIVPVLSLASAAIVALRARPSAKSLEQIVTAWARV